MQQDDIWFIATSAYAIPAGLREPRTRGGSAPDSASDWESSVRSYIIVRPETRAWERLGEQWPAEALTSCFMGDDLDDALVATAPQSTVVTSRKWGYGLLRVWLKRGKYADWEDAPGETVHLTEQNLLRTLQMAFPRFRLPSKQVK